MNSEVKIGFRADGSIEVRDAPNPEMPNYLVNYGQVALTEAQASTAVALFGWCRVSASNGFVVVERSVRDWRERSNPSGAPNI